MSGPDWPTIVFGDPTDPATRGAAIEGAVEVLATADDFAPVVMPEPLGWMEVSKAQRETLMEFQIEQWGAYQELVALRESTNAGRLAALCWAVVVLRRAVEHGDESAQGMGDDLARKIHRWYPKLRDELRVAGLDALPLSGLARQPIIRRATMDLDALPRRWRELRGVSRKQRQNRKSDDRPKSEPTPVAGAAQAALPL